MELTKQEVIQVIRQFVNSTAGPWDWDDCVSVRQSDPKLERIRVRAVAIQVEFPPTELGQYCNEAGLVALRRLANDLADDEEG